MNLEGVEKTMFLTLFAKAKHSQQKIINSMIQKQ